MPFLGLLKAKTGKRKYQQFAKCILWNGPTFWHVTCSTDYSSAPK